MGSFEQAFSDTERAAGLAIDSVKRLGRYARALDKAAKTGNIGAIQNAKDNLDAEIEALRQLSLNASWPFDGEEEARYLADEYLEELRAAAEEKGLRIYERDGNLISYPSIVRIMARDRAVRIDRKRVPTIRPSHLANELLKNQNKSSGFSPARFLESLYSVYTDIVSGDSSARHLADANGVGRVIPLARIYRLQTSLPGSGREYGRDDFARDIYRIDSEGPKQTRRGAVVSFPSSTGARRRTSDLFSFIGPNGVSVEYYGIRFDEDS